MATIDEALVSALLADATLAGLVADRVFPAGGRQGAAYPYVTYQLVSALGEGHLDGPSTLDHPRYQLDSWGESAAAASAVAEALRRAIDGKDSVTAGLRFYATWQDQRGPAPDEQTRNFRVSQDYFLWHERT